MNKFIAVVTVASFSVLTAFGAAAQGGGGGPASTDRGAQGAGSAPSANQNIPSSTGVQGQTSGSAGGAMNKEGMAKDGMSKDGMMKKNEMKK